jgi:spermidine/putrescine transport system ATP-binding protein
MNLVRISELGNRMPAEISGGQKQRVALARAIVNEPSVLLLDEPMGALDLQLRKELQTELRQLQKRLGITFVHVTHDQDEALAMSDRIAVMKAGRIEQLGTAAQLYERPRTRFVARFLGSCNLLEGTWSAGTLTLPFGQVPLALDTPPPQENITVAIRPEKIIVQGSSPAAEGLSFQARVQDIVYRGSEIQCSLRCGETLLTAVLINTHIRPELRLDGPVWCRLPSPALIPLED